MEIKTKQNSAHRCRYIKAMNQPYPRRCVDCGVPEPTIATDSTENLTKEFAMKDRSIVNKALQLQPQEPTIKLVTEELLRASSALYLIFGAKHNLSLSDCEEITEFIIQTYEPK